MTTVASGAAITSRVNSFTLTGNTPMKVDRYGFGNAGLKGEPIENAFPTITGTLGTEFFSRTEFYDVFKANTTTTLQLDFTKFDAAGNDANGVAAGPNPYRLSFILPAVKFKNADAKIGGPDINPAAGPVPGVRRRQRHQPRDSGEAGIQRVERHLDGSPVRACRLGRVRDRGHVGRRAGA